MTTNPPALCLVPSTRGRGRPPIIFNNRRVQGFVRCFVTTHELCEHHARIDDVLEGVVHLQTKGEAHTRCLSRRVLFRVLQGCSVLDTASVGGVLPGAGLSTVKRYAAAARVSARAVERLLDAHPGWEVAADRHAIDAPYHAELRAAGLF